MIPWFNIKKAAQIAAYFAREDGSRIHIVKLTKLIYLAEREFMDRHDRMMLHDNLVSMDLGPVNSITYNLCNGMYPDQGAWDALLKDRDQHEIGLRNPDLADADLDELCRAEIKVLAHTWERFGHQDPFELADWTHGNLPEWQDPLGSSIPIQHEDVFAALGKAELSRELAEQVEDDRALAAVFAEVD